MQQRVHLLVLRDDQQPRRSHVQTVHNQLTVVVGIAFAHQRHHRLGHLAARNGEHVGWFVDYRQPLILVHRLQFRTAFKVDIAQGCLSPHPQFAVVVGTLQHPCQYGQAFAPAGRIILSVVPHLGFWRCSPPELSHAHGAQSLLVGILQQLRGTAVARTAWRQREFAAHLRPCVVVLPNLHQVLCLAPSVQHPVLPEQPLLQLFRHLFAQRLQPFAFLVGQFTIRVSQPFIQVRNHSLRLFEMPVRLLGIIHRRHKLRPVVATRQQPRVGSQETQLVLPADACFRAFSRCAFCELGRSVFCVLSRSVFSVLGRSAFHHQHAEHLPVVGILFQHRVSFNPPFHLLSGQQAQLMRLIVERVVHPLRFLYVGV